MAERKPAVFFYLEEEVDELLLYSDDLESGDMEHRRMSYGEYMEERTDYHGHDEMDIYSLAELYLEEHPLNALQSDMTSRRTSQDIANELRRRRDQGEDIDMETLSERLQQENPTQVLDMEEFRERIAVETGMTVS